MEQDQSKTETPAAVRSSDGLGRRRESSSMRAYRRFLPIFFVSQGWAMLYSRKLEWLGAMFLAMGFAYLWLLEEKKDTERKRPNSDYQTAVGYQSGIKGGQ